MEKIIEIFGHGKDLSFVQMGCRGILVFFIALILIRISGRRSFGIRSPLDNIIVIMLGAILSRAVVGVSPFIPIVFTSLILVLLHRILGRFLSSIKWLSKLIEGEKIILFDNGDLIPENMHRSMVGINDIMQGVRKSALTDNLDKIEKIYIESTGEISTIKK